MKTQRELFAELERKVPRLCARIVCQQPGAAFPHSDNTGRHYCWYCARKINRQPGQDNLIPIPYGDDLVKFVEDLPEPPA